MKTLAEMVGQTVLMRSVVLDEADPVVVKLHAVENGNGIWVESQRLTEFYTAELEEGAPPRTLVWFVPFAQIAWIMGTRDHESSPKKR